MFRARRLNVRLFLLLVGLLTAGAIGVHFLHAFQVHRQANEIKLRAEKSLEAGRLADAVREFTLYLSLAPDDTDALAMLGLLLEQDAVSARARLRVFLMFERVLQLDPGRADIRSRLVDVSMKLRRYDIALGHLARLDPELRKKVAQDLKSQRSAGTASGDPRPFEILLASSSAENVFLGARCYDALSRYDEAARLYLKVIDLAEGEVEYYERLVELLIRHADELPRELQREIDPLHREDVEAETLPELLMGVAVEKGQPKHRAYLARARFRMRQRRIAAAEDDLVRALGLRGNDPEVLLMATELRIHQAELARIEGNPDGVESYLIEAAEYAREGLQQEPPDLRFFLTLAQIEIQRERFAEAVKVLEGGYQRSQELLGEASRDKRAELVGMRYRLLFSLTDALISVAQLNAEGVDEPGLAKAESRLKELRDLGTTDVLTGFLEARLLAARQQWYSARLKFEQVQLHVAVLPELPRRLALELGECHRHLGNPDALLSVFRKLVREDPLWLPGRLGLAVALEAAGRMEEAIVEYQTPQLLQLADVPARLARLLMLRQLQMPQARRDWSAVERALNLAEEVAKRVDPESADELLLRAEVRAQQGSFDAARSVLEEAERRKPEEVDVRTAQSQLAMRRTDWEKAQRFRDADGILDRAEKELGDHVEFRLTRADLAVLQGNEQARKSLPELEKEIEKFGPEDQYALLKGLARAYETIGARDRSTALWQRLASQRPRDLTAQMVLAELAIDEQDRQTFGRLLETIRGIEGPDGPNGNYVAAAQLIEVAKRGKDKQPKLAEARELLNAAAAARPSWPAVPRALGLLEELAENRQIAFDRFRQAIGLGDRTREILLYVVQYLTERKRYDEAHRELVKLTAGSDEFLTGGLAREAWKVAWHRQDFDRALRLSADLAAESGNVIDLIWSSRLRYARGMRGDAVEAPLVKAITSEAGKQSPQAWIAWISYLVRTREGDERKKAVADAIRQAEQSVPPELVAATLGRCHELANNFAEAEKQYRKAYQTRPGDVTRMKMLAAFYGRNGKDKEAEEFLRKIFDTDTKATPEDVDWALRHQALLLASRGGYQSAAQALAALERSIRRKGGPSLQDLRAKAVILANQPGRRDRLLAIPVLEQIRRQHWLESAEQFQLARLYDLAGDWPRSRELMQGLLSSEETNGFYLAFYVRALIRHGDLADAQNWTNRLEKLEPNTFRTVATKARLLHAQGQGESVASLLKSYVENQKTLSPDEALERLVEQENLEEAIEAFEESLGQTADETAAATLAQAKQLLEQSRPNEAVTVLKQFLQSQANREVLEIATIRAAAALCEELEQIDAARELFELYVQRSPRPDAVLLLADFLGNHQQLDEALRLCEQARATCKPELVAMATASIIKRGPVDSVRLEAVQEWMDSVIRETPDSPTYHVALGDLRIVQNRLREAETHYRMALQQNAKNYIALNNLAWLLAMQEREGAEAIELINRAIDMRGRLPALLDTRSLVYLSQRKPQKAIADLEEALADSLPPIGYYHLALAYHRLRDSAKTQECLQKAEEEGFEPDSLLPVERKIYDDLESRFASRTTN